MPSHATVGVDDDLAAGEPAVGVRAALLEASRRVDEHVEVVAGELLGQQRLDHVLDQRRLERSVDAEAGLVLGGDQHVAEPFRDAILVLDRHLRLAVRADERQRAVPPDLGQALRETVREPDRHRHEVGGVIAGVAEHHALVARPDLVVVVSVAGAELEGLVDALRDI